MDGELLKLEAAELSMLSNKKLNLIITSKGFKHIPKNMQDKILDLKYIVERY